MTKPIVLFILKRKPNVNPEKPISESLSTGLFNSASYMVDMLLEQNVDARFEIAIDNNCIDRLVTKHRPTHVIIEALWVVPSKFTILSKLHPTVNWIIRLHSEMPFLAGEGSALNWLGDYGSYDNITIGVNSPRMVNDVGSYLKIKYGWSNDILNKKIVYMPNFYPQTYKTKEYNVNKEYIDIGCFGAIRPLKNHLLQAISSVKFAEQLGKKLHFHINVGRMEMKGDSVMSNLDAMFQHLHDKGHRLVGHEWTPRDGFLDLCGEMDIGLQVSFSETFNIVGADIISQGVPLVGSVEIPWIDPAYSARSQAGEEIYNALMLTHSNPYGNVYINQRKLTEYTNQTRNTWLAYFKEK